MTELAGVEGLSKTGGSEELCGEAAGFDRLGSVSPAPSPFLYPSELSLDTLTPPLKRFALKQPAFLHPLSLIQP